eukprot:1333584-Amorphochlora_amoeboformis.AAC.1
MISSLAEKRSYVSTLTIAKFAEGETGEDEEGGRMNRRNRGMGEKAGRPIDHGDMRGGGMWYSRREVYLGQLRRFLYY